MKNLFVALFAVLFLGVGCSPPVFDNRQKTGSKYDIVTIDNCEYIEVDFVGGAYSRCYSLTHKGNCKNPIHRK